MREHSIAITVAFEVLVIMAGYAFYIMFFGALGVLLFVFLAIAIFAMVSGGRYSDRPLAGRTTLICPHCGEETRADRPNCKHCKEHLIG